MEAQLKTLDLAQEYRAIRAMTRRLAAPLTPEDCQIQSMPDVSPTKWHLAHSTWFFETFVLSSAVKGFQSSRPEYRVLYNSYYNGVGEQHPRAQRGLLSRPSLDEVWEYRDEIDARMDELLTAGVDAELAAVIEVGLHHEQQHQELLLMDIKHVLGTNPLHPAYRKNLAAGVAAAQASVSEQAPLRWYDFGERIHWLGHEGEGFAYDNELPRHQRLTQPFSLASRLVTNGEYREFINTGGYENPELWLSNAWAHLAAEGWTAPLYWRQRGAAWYEQTLGGLEPLRLDAPVVHVSYYEADAFARWKGCRLPSEAEWELAARSEHALGPANDLGADHLHPLPCPKGDGIAQLLGDAWEWTHSSYEGYPGYTAAPGALGEYNGKFMCDQQVLRGASCVTPARHSRVSYRNFFPAAARWQFAGIRLAKDVTSSCT
jgi:ergothioneine biosynthesis protein EgtB